MARLTIACSMVLYMAILASVLNTSWTVFIGTSSPLLAARTANKAPSFQTKVQRSARTELQKEMGSDESPRRNFAIAFAATLMVTFQIASPAEARGLKLAARTGLAQTATKSKDQTNANTSSDTDVKSDKAGESQKDQSSNAPTSSG